MKEIFTVYTTVATKAQAEELSYKVIEQRLAGCTNISSPITSIFRWDDAVQQEEEFAILFKTTSPEQLIDFLNQHHPYDLPAIILHKAQANTEFANYLTL